MQLPDHPLLLPFVFRNVKAAPSVFHGCVCLCSDKTWFCKARLARLSPEAGVCWHQVQSNEPSKREGTQPCSRILTPHTALTGAAVLISRKGYPPHRIIKLPGCHIETFFSFLPAAVAFSSAQTSISSLTADFSFWNLSWPPLLFRVLHLLTPSSGVFLPAFWREGPALQQQPHLHPHSPPSLSTMRKWKWRHSVLSHSLPPCGLLPTRFLHPWDSPGKNAGVGCHFLLQGIFPTQGSKPMSPALQADALPSEPPGKPEALWGDLETDVPLQLKERVIINTNQGLPCLIQVKPPYSLAQSKCLGNDCHLYTGSLVRTIGGCQMLCKCKLLSSPVAGRGTPSRAWEWTLVQHSEVSCLRRHVCSQSRRPYWRGRPGENSRARGPGRTALQWLVALGLWCRDSFLGCLWSVVLTQGPSWWHHSDKLDSSEEDSGRTYGLGSSLSFWPFLSSSGWWWLVSSMLLTRISRCKTACADGHCGTWPGWVVSVGVSPESIMEIRTAEAFVQPGKLRSLGFRT